MTRQRPEVLRLDYVRTARAKGLSERSVLFGQVLKNAGLPILTTAGIQFGFLLGGTVLTETIFQWPGVGQYAVASISNLDFNAIVGVTIVVSTLFVLINLVVDVLYSYLDPRIRY
jgi:peptide/nickel transport system permease protein